MKKFILVLIIFLLTGCYDYNELTDLGIVSAMFIDYKNDEYVVNLEVLDTNEMVVEPSYFIVGMGKSFEEALNDVYNKSTTHVYLHHMDTVVLSDNVAEDKLTELYDYFLRDPDIRKDSYFVMSKNIDSFLNFRTIDKLSIGESVKNIIKYNEKENAHFKTSLFSDILHSYLNEATYFLGEIEIEDDLIVLQSTYVVKDNKLMFNLDKEAVLFANVLDNSKSSFVITLDDSYEIYQYKLEKKVSKDKISILMNANMRLFAMTKDATKSQKDMKIQEEKISAYLRKSILESIKYSIDNETDIYNFNYLYHLYRPLDCERDSWKNVEYEVSVDVSLNERGLILDTLRRGVNER